jgi:hypothetical protein
MCRPKLITALEGRNRSPPPGLPEHEPIRLRDQILNDLARAWEITGSNENELASIMLLHISQVVAKGFYRNDSPGVGTAG